MEKEKREELVLKEKMKRLEESQKEYISEYSAIEDAFNGKEYFRIKKLEELESKSQGIIYSATKETFWQPNKMIVHSISKSVKIEQDRLLKQVDCYCILLKDAKGMPVNLFGYSILNIEVCVDYDTPDGKEKMTAYVFDGKQLTSIDARKPEKLDVLNQIFSYVDEFNDAKKRYLDSQEQERIRQAQEKEEEIKRVQKEKLDSERREKERKENLQKENEWIESYKKNLESYIGK